MVLVIPPTSTPGCHLLEKVRRKTKCENKRTANTGQTNHVCKCKILLVGGMFEKTQMETKIHLTELSATSSNFIFQFHPTRWIMENIWSEVSPKGAVCFCSRLRADWHTDSRTKSLSSSCPQIRGHLRSLTRLRAPSSVRDRICDKHCSSALTTKSPYLRWKLKTYIWVEARHKGHQQGQVLSQPHYRRISILMVRQQRENTAAQICAHTQSERGVVSINCYITVWPRSIKFVEPKGYGKLTQTYTQIYYSGC